MKNFLSILAVLAFLIGGFIYMDLRSSSRLEMGLPRDLDRAVNIMNRIQSLSLNPSDSELGSVSDSDIAHMQDVYDRVDEYVLVVDEDIVFRRDRVSAQLEEMFPGSIGIDAAVAVLSSPVAFVNTYEVYVSIVSVKLAQALEVDVSYVSASESLMEDAFYLSAAAWTKRMYWRFEEGFEKFRES